MAKGFKHGGSGGADPLNFKVKTYPSETELKADKPRENTIGVITTTTMNSWVFSATEPTEPEVGMVWISVGKSSAVEFNAIKKNTLQVYPLSAKQYVSGAWAKKTALSYQNSKWSEWWNGELYSSGNEFTHVTGGWEAKVNNTKTATLTKGTSSLTLNAAGMGSTSGLAGIKNSTPIDLSEYNTLQIRVTSVSSSSSALFGIVSTYKFNTEDGYLNFNDVLIASKDCASVGTFDLDISSIDKGLPLVKVAAEKSITFDLLLLK